MERAKLVAARRGDEVVGTAHLLLGLLDDPAGPVGEELRGLGVDTDRLRNALAG
ncbi:hypothetical protein FXN61_17405 [Lentzea sp. PSKA42]|uniref:Clp R domain-containing protein n=1 Tax=Lentzea indica TaxID=2604800 RepID=A0ABX1FHX9_9PSEU|nr:Clp protease N-terminal domain-containing protein [Lentzea indica]NKE58502.1 hypothetical protein [Lentzea indica]